MSEFIVDGQTYRSNRMPVRTQFHVARKLAPALGTLAPVLKSAELAPGADEAARAAFTGRMLEVVLPEIAKAIASMDEADCNYIIDACLQVTDRQQGGGLWAKVMTPRGALMFDDLELPQMMQIVYTVLGAALGPFFGAAPSISSRAVA